ncbi:CLUMA_CG009934, isoform A [Clunio marinus]|uniref:CLUMA_CG009934, isoform A n=1 Tax=Clunio marinus TaxID=568069 RepID=A0A1J1IEJ8_9DIPT|nr:CLUMA_CG009934, isoform A [Clunio marinus]
MYSTRYVKVPLWNSLCTIILTSSLLIGLAVCSDSENNANRRIPPSGSGSGGLEKRSSFAVLSQAMSETFNSEIGSAASGSESCTIDDFDCPTYSDQIGLEAIRSLHRQLDDDDNGDIDLSESDDFLREELKYEGGYEKRHRAFHFNDDMHISVKELWEAWLKSEVHNWTLDQTCEWLTQSVQLPQYVNLFKKHKITGSVLPRLAVNNLHFVSNVLGIKDPIHKQKIALKAMDAVLFGPPRETGTKWKDIFLVALLLTAIIGSWYAYQQNKNAKGHLKRMARDMEQLHKAETELSKMQTELEQARLEQENVGKEKMDLERRLKEAPSLKSSSSEVELQQLRQEIELLRNELSRAEVELIDHHWTPPAGLQHWLQLTYELETRSHQKKRIAAESQLLQAREACEKLRKKRSSFVGAFVSTHGKSIDDVDRTIVEARNSLSEVTHELQERLHRWKQVETLIGCPIVNNNGIAFLENMLYRSNASSKTSRGRITSSQDDLDDDSIQGYLTDVNKYLRERDESSGSDDDRDHESVTFLVGGGYEDPPTLTTTVSPPTIQTLTTSNSVNPMRTSMSYPIQLMHQGSSLESNNNSNEETRSNISSSSEKTLPPAPPRAKKQISFPLIPAQSIQMTSRAPMPPPRRTTTNPNIALNTACSAADFVEPFGPITTLSTTTSVTDAKLPPAIQQYQQFEDSISTDSSSIGDEKKKRKRKLFAFGKKSSKTKVKNT